MSKPHILHRLRRGAGVGLHGAALSPLALARLVLAANIALNFAGSTGGQARAAQGGGGQVLAPCEAGRRQMKPGEKHACVLRLAPRQFARVVVAQQGVDVGINLYAPGGAAVAAMDSPNGLFGLEAVSVVAEAEGDYKVEVYSYSGTPAGDYELRVEGPRDTTAADERRVTAERLFVEAQVLRLGVNAKTPREQAQEQYNLAIGKYSEALPLWRELDDARGEGYSLYGIGRSYTALAQPAAALDYMGRARERLRAAGDVPGEAFVLNEMGGTHRELGDPLQALDCYASALKLRVALNDSWGQAQLYNNVGLTYSNTGSQLKAIENLEKAISIWHGMAGQRLNEMRAVGNAAKAYVEMGDLDAALERYRAVLGFCDAEAPASPLKPMALNGLGLVYDTRGDPERAGGNYQQALELFRAAGDLKGQADVLDNLGMMHAFLGDATKALEYFHDALDLRQRLNEPKGRAITLSNIGYAETLLGDNQGALRHFELALALSEQARDRRFQAYTLFRTGMAYVASGDPRKALDIYERALALQSGEDLQDHRGQALTLDKIGEALSLLGEASQALGRYERAIELWKGVGDRQGQALSLYGVARLELGRNNLANARDRIEEAIGIVEALRYRVSGRQLRMTYFAARQDFYALDIDARTRLYELTHSAADVEAALWASERARARGLLDLLYAARANANRGLPPGEAEADRRLEDEISELTQAYFRLGSLGKSEEAAAVEHKLAAYIGQQDELRARAAGAGAGAEQFRPLKPREIQQLLDPDTLLLQYSLGEERSHLWLVTGTDIEHHFLAGRAELEKAAGRLRQALTAYEPRRPGESAEQYVRRWKGAPELYNVSALELSRLVLGDALPRLGGKRLIIVADGALQYIPFEALPIPEAATPAGAAPNPPAPAVLLSRNEVTYLPSASALALLREAHPRKALRTVAVFADPVFDNKDERVRPPAGGRAAAPTPRPADARLMSSLRDLGDLGEGVMALPKLGYSLREANAIKAVAPRGSKLAVGFQANRAAVMSPSLKQFSIIHFATHGILNDKHPELSGIVLSLVNERGESEDGYLTLHDIYSLDLPVDLVVLSACRTGIGKQVRGEGLLGLTRGFMYAGSPRVVASLWHVDDEASAELMRRFYLYMLRNNDKTSASAALRKAKLDMMQGGSEWRAPYYWAGFVLQGDWK